MLTILLAGPGGNWMGLLIPLILLVVILKSGQYLYNRGTAWNYNRKHRNHNIIKR